MRKPSYRRMHFLHKFFSHSLRFESRKVGSLGSPETAHLQQRGSCLEIDTASRNVPVDRVDLRGFFQHFPPFPIATFTLIRLMSWVMEDTWEISRAQVCKSLATAGCNSTTSQSPAVVSWQLQGISRRLDHIDRRMLLSNKYGILLLTVITRPSPPLHIDLLYSCFTYLHLSMSFLVCLWLEGLAMSQSWLAFRGWAPTSDKFLPTPPESEVKWGCWSVDGWTISWS